MVWEACRIENLFDLEQTIAADYLRQFIYPWEALDGIGAEILRIGAGLPEEEYEQRGEGIWVARSAKVAPTALLCGPVIIGKDAEVRHCAFVRGKAIVGEGAVVGNSTELKNVILFNKVQVPHYNYVGDSILGFRAHMGAGSITSNIKSDRSPVKITMGGECLETGRIKMGAMLGDGVEVGCNSVMNPGTIIGPNSNIYPLSMVRGVVPASRIYKNRNEVVEKQAHIEEGQ